MVKNVPAHAGDMGLIPGLGRSSGGGQWQPTPVFLPGESAWTEEPGGLQSVGSQSQTRLRDLTLSSWCSGTTQQYRLGREMGGEFRTWYGGGTHVYF